MADPSVAEVVTENSELHAHLKKIREEAEEKRLKEEAAKKEEEERKAAEKKAKEDEKNKKKLEKEAAKGKTDEEKPPAVSLPREAEVRARIQKLQESLKSSLQDIQDTAEEHTTAAKAQHKVELDEIKTKMKQDMKFRKNAHRQAINQWNKVLTALKASPEPLEDEEDEDNAVVMPVVSVSDIESETDAAVS